MSASSSSSRPPHGGGNPAAMNPSAALLRSFTIFNPTLSRGNEEKAMDNIIYYYPSSDDNNKQMNRVGFCVACACICERFSLRNDSFELADEIQTDGSVTVLFSPAREVWVSAEVDPTIDTLAMRLIIEKAVGSYVMLHGMDGLEIEAPPHKRYVMGSDPAYEARLEASNVRKRSIVAFFSDFINFLNRYALIPMAVGPAGPSYNYKHRAAADALIALPTIIPTIDAAAFLRFDVLCSHYETYLGATDEAIREALIGGSRAGGDGSGNNRRQSSTSHSELSTPSASTSAAAPPSGSFPTAPLSSSSSSAAAAAAAGGPPLQFVIGSVDDCRLLYSSAPDIVSHKLLFLARTQIQYLEDKCKRKVNMIHYRASTNGTDGGRKGGPSHVVTQPMLFVHRSGYIVFIIGPPINAPNNGSPNSNTTTENGKGGRSNDEGTRLLEHIVANRLSLVSDLIVCVELLATQPFGKASELRTAALATDCRRITEALMGKQQSNNNGNGNRASTSMSINNNGGGGRPSSSSAAGSTSGAAPPTPAEVLRRRWVSALNVPLVAPIGTATSAAIFSPSPLSLMSCLPDGPIAFTPRSPRGRLYPASSDPTPIPRCSESQPTVVGFNRGFAYGTPLAALPRMAQIAVAHYMSEMWRNHYGPLHSTTGGHAHVYGNVMNIAVPPASEEESAALLDDETMMHFNQHYRHTLIEHVNAIRFHGRVAEVTGSRQGGAPPLTLPTMMVDSEKDIADVWIPIAVKPMAGMNAAASSSSSGPSSPPPSSADADPAQYGVALLAIAQFNGRVVAIYFPPRNRQSFIEQINMATQLFSTAFKGSGFV